VTDKTDFDFALLPKPYGLDQLCNAIDTLCPRALHDSAKQTAA